MKEFKTTNDEAVTAIENIKSWKQGNAGALTAGRQSVGDRINSVAEAVRAIEEAEIATREVKTEAGGHKRTDAKA